jgi:hypothetical protein
MSDCNQELERSIPVGQDGSRGMSGNPALGHSIAFPTCQTFPDLPAISRLGVSRTESRPFSRIVAWGRQDGGAAPPSRVRLPRGLAMSWQCTQHPQLPVAPPVTRLIEVRLPLDVAHHRPLFDAMTVRRGKRKGERYADVRPEVRDRLDLRGRERALIYKTLVLSGFARASWHPLPWGKCTSTARFAMPPSTPPTKRTGKGTTCRDGTTSPPTCGLGSPTSSTACSKRRWRTARRYPPGCRPIRLFSTCPRDCFAFSTVT